MQREIRLDVLDQPGMAGEGLREAARRNDRRLAEFVDSATQR